MVIHLFKRVNRKRVGSNNDMLKNKVDFCLFNVTVNAFFKNALVKTVFTNVFQRSKPSMYTVESSNLSDFLAHRTVLYRTVPHRTVLYVTGTLQNVT
jgi:hypothetical protein